MLKKRNYTKEKNKFCREIMALILNIETTTDNCSVTLAKDGELLNIAEQREGRLHASLLTTFIERVIKESGNSFDMLDAVGISKGPGSYTGLRIGVSAAKGICYALDIPLVAVHTLQAMNEQVVNNRQKYGLHKGETNLSFIPMIDARRMEVYSAVFNIENEFERDVEAEVLDENSYSELLKNSKAVFFGNGAGKFQEIIDNPNAIFLKDISPTAGSMISLAEKKYQNKEFEDVAYFEPFYLKEFITTIPKKKIL